MLVGQSVGRPVGWFLHNFKKVLVTSCEVYTVQTVHTGQGPGTVHVYTQSWAEHSQGQSKNIGMIVDIAVICCQAMIGNDIQHGHYGQRIR